MQSYSSSLHPGDAAADAYVRVVLERSVEVDYPCPRHSRVSYADPVPISVARQDNLELEFCPGAARWQWAVRE
jgi:hypothetical protein